MKYIYTCLLIMMSLVVGCANQTTNEDTLGEKSAKQSVNKDENESSQKKNETINEEQETEKSVEENLLNYRPKVGATKEFYENGQLVYTEKIVAANEEFVQRVIFIGETPSVQVLKWTEDEITIVYEESEVSEPNKDIINSFKEFGKSDSARLETFIGKHAIWEIQDKKAKIKVSFGSFENVYIIKKVTDEVQGEDTIYTYYLAPGMGLIKEEFELTGDQGYKAGAELNKVIE